MDRLLSEFPIPPHVRFKLNNAGFTTIEDLSESKPLELMKETGLNLEEATELLELVFPQGNKNVNSVSAPPVAISALDLFQKEQSCTPIITFCQKLDEILGGGISLTKLTEICGTPGTGKTQMSLQLCVDVQIPTLLGGVEGEAVYINSEGTFVVQRLHEIAMSTIEHCKYIATQKQSQEIQIAVEAFTIDRILSGVHFFCCLDYIQVLAVINILPEFLKSHQKVKLIVIDSIAFPFRYGFDGNFSVRTRLLNGISQSLISLASKFTLAVVLTNQMTTKVTEGKEAKLVPALGESWGHACTVRIILFWQKGGRFAQLYKSPWRQEAIVPYQITCAGIRDLVTLPEPMNLDETSHECPPAKIPRI